ncbi:MAG: transposase, partial [Acidimicrobiales bacterium]
ARCGEISLVSADAAEWIASVVTERCPNATLCADAFHVVKVRREAPCVRGRVRDPPLRAVAAVW